MLGIFTSIIFLFSLPLVAVSDDDPNIHLELSIRHDGDASHEIDCCNGTSGNGNNGLSCEATNNVVSKLDRLEELVLSLNQMAGGNRRSM